MKRKVVLSLLSIFLLSLVTTNAVFAQQQQKRVKYVVVFQVINPDTLELITNPSSLEVNPPLGRPQSNSWVQSQIRQQIGWGSNSDYRTKNGVRQKLVFISINEIPL